MRSGFRYNLFRIIFYCCSAYFLFMGAGLVLFPGILADRVAGTDVHPAITGMLRGSGGAIIPYSLLYFLTAKKPLSRKWGIYVIALANVIAILLDTVSVLLAEYKLGYAMMDLPIEVASLIGIALIWNRIRRNSGCISNSDKSYI